MACVPGRPYKWPEMRVCAVVFFSELVSQLPKEAVRFGNVALVRHQVH